MIFLVHTAYDADNVRFNLGQPEYSYYFVLREFLPVLEQIGRVVHVSDPQREVDPAYRKCQERDERCVFLAFMPPNKVPISLDCPTIPVFAWEYGSIPNESFSGKPRNDWRRVLTHLGMGITHSSFAADVVRKELGHSFPIIVAPAPLWDGMSQHRNLATRMEYRSHRLSFDGLLIDSRKTNLELYTTASVLQDKRPLPPLPDEREEGDIELELDGIVYTSVLNPGDPRKNWIDMISAFCEAFRYTKDATLVLKLSHYAIRDVIAQMLAYIRRGGDMACRIVIIDGYLDDEAYGKLIESTRYTVNSSNGEGQCLPLMEYMSCGIPAIAPRHTAMLDYIDETCAFVVESSPAPGTWPHDMRQAYRTLREKVHFSSLVRAFRASHHVACHEPETYRHMSASAIESLRAFCSRAVVRARLETFLHAHASQRCAANDGSMGR